MEGRIPQELVTKIIEAHNIIDIVGQHVTLKKSGRSYFGLCPFHSEKTPSFSVSESKQIYHCFGCKAGGDLIQFVMEMENMTFVEAILELARQKGIQLPEATLGARKKGSELEKMYEILETTSKFYHHILVNTDVGQEARDYLSTRGIDSQTISTFQLGYSPNSSCTLYSFLNRRGYSESILLKLGLIGHARSSYYDSFRNRVMFPIHDPKGDVIGFGGRMITEGAPKYLNSKETPLFHKGKYLYNFHRARSFIRKEKQALLFEGYMDVLGAWQAGIHVGVASLGTSLTDRQAKQFKKITDQVTICYDADFAGQSAAINALDTFKIHTISTKVAQIPMGLDPDDYIRKHGVSSFQENILGSALSAMAFQLESLKRQFALQDEEQKTKYIIQAITLISTLPHVIEQEYYLKNLAEEFHIPLSTIKEEQRKIRYENRKNKIRDKDSEKWNNGYHKISQYLSNQSKVMSIVEKSEQFLVAYMMRDESISSWVQDKLGDRFCTEIYGALAAYLYGYYARGNRANMRGFINTLPDKELKSKASELAMLELPDRVVKSALLDYVRHIVHAPLQEEILEKEKQVKYLTKADQPVKAAELTLEITKLKRKLLTLEDDGKEEQHFVK